MSCEWVTLLHHLRPCWKYQWNDKGLKTREKEWHLLLYPNCPRTLRPWVPHESTMKKRKTGKGTACMYIYLIVFLHPCWDVWIFRPLGFFARVTQSTALVKMTMKTLPRGEKNVLWYWQQWFPCSQVCFIFYLSLSLTSFLFVFIVTFLLVSNYPGMTRPNLNTFGFKIKIWIWKGEMHFQVIDLASLKLLPVLAFLWTFALSMLLHSSVFYLLLFV